MTKQREYNPLKPPPDKLTKHQLSEMMKALESGDDSRVRAAMFRMQVDEIDYILQLVHRLRGLLISGRLKALEKHGG